jgi:hypothetical protein
LYPVPSATVKVAALAANAIAAIANKVNNFFMIKTKLKLIIRGYNYLIVYIILNTTAKIHLKKIINNFLEENK